MVLTGTELSALIHGALSTEHTDDGYVIPHRLTEKQREFYKCLEKPYPYACSTPNVRLAFRTDATDFSIDYRITCGKKCNFDLFVDGAMCWHYYENVANNTTGTFTFTLPAGTHDVVLYLPYLARASLANLTVPDGATVTPLPWRPTMLLLGDSITQGALSEYPSNTYANLISDMLGVCSLNQGVAGEIFRPDMIDSEIGFAPEIVTVAYGTNDFSKCKSAEEVIKNATEYYRRVRATFPKAKLFCILPIWRADHEPPRATGSFFSVRQSVRTAAEAVGATVIDALNFVPRLPEFFKDLRLHPNDLGFLHYASGLYRAMLPHLKEN